eukprot:CAMPEP_0203680316 /NCGR_PEP_ID=MMETSP0090-20130426/38776_1 /ASSEMBLY_ACC=CAM_ASM_001088 /TAXON_ID=426623 /ORGANISM="Chaetoceros affinis, Strain CCMP159" /LENGTH=854 /DNA_ID=CAMNT_0050548327 /DNA_START=195 /DNA_END=2759 /DNA_ORIENTATION=-
MTKLAELTSNNMNRGQIKNCLSKTPWHRLVVDECQFLKNNTTAIARAASVIDAKHIWMLSGTPLTNKLDDLRGELSLLRVWPFTLGASDDGWQDHFWSNNIKGNWDKKNRESLPIINKLMEAVSMRHSRLQTRADGSPLVDLPPRKEQFVAVTMDSPSSSAFINQWMEVLAASFLQIFGRFDIQVTSLILKLQQLITMPVLVLEGLEQIDANLSQLKELSRASTNKGIQVVDLRTAVMEEKKKSDSLILPELVSFAKGESTFTCNYCQKVSFEPSYMKCGHSICATCCEILLKTGGEFACPVCMIKVQPKDLMQVQIPEILFSRRKTSKQNINTKGAELAIDMDEDDVDNILADQNLIQSDSLSSEDISSFKVKETTYETKIEEAGINFQQKENDSMVCTFDALKNYPRPVLSSKSEAEAKETIASLTNRKEMEALVRHAIACEDEQSPKVRAICENIQLIRDKSLEAKICIFSSYSRILDELHAALDNIRYSVEYNMDTRTNLLPGQSCTLHTGERGSILGKTSQDTTEDEISIDLYRIKLLDGTITVVSREEIEIDPVIIENVESKFIRKSSSDKKLSINGSDGRFIQNENVESKRPIVSSLELQVGYNVEILPTYETGQVVFVHKEANGGIYYDVRPDGYNQVMINGSMEAIRKDVLLRVDPCRLQDRGGSNWLPAKIKSIKTKHRLSDKDFVENSDSDPFKNVIGFSRLDGSAGDAFRRGEILDTFKRDPMTSICLLTKRSAGVGINLTDANHVIIVEPGIDGHDELQSICRVHRIGQTRSVLVQKFYMVGSVEQRILKRRQQRGDLHLSINSVTGSNAGEEEKGQKKSEVLSSKAIMYEDLRLLLGVSQ